MSGKKISFKKFKESDKTLLHALRCCGVLSTKHLKDLGVTTTRAKTLIANDIIEKHYFFNKQTQQEELIFKLSSYGKSFCEKELRYSNFYHAPSAKHDLKLADVYVSLKDEERQTWKTETDWREAYNSRYRYEYEMLRQYSEHSISAFDYSYINSHGIEICREIITDSYSAEDEASKDRFAEAMDVKLEKTDIKN